MKKMLVLIVVFLIGVSVFAQFEQQQERAKAYRAAKVDAMRQLGEAIKGLRISATTVVKDFVTEKDEINAAMEAFLQGAQVVGEPRYLQDGTVEVDMEVNVEQLVQWLQNMWYTYGSNKVHSAQEIQKIKYTTSSRVIKATGSGAMKIAPVPTMGVDVWSRVTAQGKAMAIRTARVDAYRNLAEAIQGVKISATTVVRDFVTESDEIKAAFNGFVQGAEFVGQPNYRPEGVVEVVAQVDLQRLIQMLSSICQRHYSGNEFQPGQFQDIQNYTSSPIIRAVGTGVPPAKYVRPAPVVPVVPVEPVIPVEPEPYVPEWAKRTVRVTGTGAVSDDHTNPGQAKIMAQRAAMVDGYRLLVEQVMGLRLTATTTVRDFVTESDEINAKVIAYIKAGQVENIRHKEDGTVEVDMSLWLGNIWQLIEAHQRRRQ